MRYSGNELAEAGLRRLRGRTGAQGLGGATALASRRKGSREGSPGSLAEVLEAIDDAVYAMDRDERILFANRRALQLWGKSSEEVVGQLLLAVFPGIAGGEPYRAYRSVLTTREPVHLETVASALGGRWIELDVHPAPHGGLVVVFRDIDNRKRSEAALRD